MNKTSLSLPPSFTASPFLSVFSCSSSLSLTQSQGRDLAVLTSQKGLSAQFPSSLTYLTGTRSFQAVFVPATYFPRNMYVSVFPLCFCLLCVCVYCLWHEHTRGTFSTSQVPTFQTLYFLSHDGLLCVSVCVHVFLGVSVCKCIHRMVKQPQPPRVCEQMALVCSLSCLVCASVRVCVCVCETQRKSE